jgi:esterase/lipase superfamily enzyme
MNYHPYYGHLGGREQIVKPTLKGRFFSFNNEVAHINKDRERNPSQ